MGWNPGFLTPRLANTNNDNICIFLEKNPLTVKRSPLSWNHVSEKLCSASFCRCKRKNFTLAVSTVPFLNKCWDKLLGMHRTPDPHVPLHALCKDQHQHPKEEGHCTLEHAPSEQDFPCWALGHRPSRQMPLASMPWPIKALSQVVWIPVDPHPVPLPERCDPLDLPRGRVAPWQWEMAIARSNLQTENWKWPARLYQTLPDSRQWDLFGLWFPFQRRYVTISS